MENRVVAFSCTDSVPFSPHVVNAAVARHRGQDNMAAAAGRYYGEGGRATKRQKTEDGGMTTVRVSSLPWWLVWYYAKKCHRFCFSNRGEAK